MHLDYIKYHELNIHLSLGLKLRNNRKNRSINNIYNLSARPYKRTKLHYWLSLKMAGDRFMLIKEAIRDQQQFITMY